MRNKVHEVAYISKKFFESLPCVRNTCKVVGCHPVSPGLQIHERFSLDQFQTPMARIRKEKRPTEVTHLEMNQTIASWPVDGKFPPNDACATPACRRTACRSSRSNTCAQASLKSLTSSGVQCVFLVP